MLHKDNLIELREVKFGYSPSKPVLNGVDFTFHRGEKVSLSGPNGSGKTTLFYLIMGLLKPQQGEIKIFQKERVKERDFIEVRQRVGLVFQDPDDQLFCPTVIEDIAFGPLNLGKSREDAKKIALKTLSSLGLEGYENRVTYHLSGGEKRLVALATVLAMEPDLVLFDEPVSELDEENQERFISLLQNIESYIIVSHDRGFLKKVTEKSYIVMEGKIREG